MRVHKYTEQEKVFLVDYIPGHSYKEIQEAFTARFGWEISLTQIKGYIGNHHFNTGRTGRFEKGSVPHNKGMKGTYYAGCEKTWFKKGGTPHNHREVGSERINKDGYIEVKVAEPNVWKHKHRHMWEAANGPIPDGYAVIFADNNRLNTDISNLRLIKRSTNAVLNHTGLCKYAGNAKDTAICIAELCSATSQHRRRKREGGEDDDGGV